MGSCALIAQKCDEAGDCGKNFVIEVPVTFVEYVRAEAFGNNRAVENVSAARVYRMYGV